MQQTMPGSDVARPPVDRELRRAELRRTYMRRRVATVAVLGVLVLVGVGVVWSATSGGGDVASGTTGGAGGVVAAPAVAVDPTTTASTTPPTTLPATTVPDLIVGPLTDGPGPVPVIHRIPTFDPVVFITIDDGVTRDDAVLDIIAERNVPITAFLTQQYVKADPEWFQRLQSLGTAEMASHSISHANLLRLDAAAQTDEVCGPSTLFTEVFGTAPTLFRPPYGNWNPTTLQVASTCGMQAVVHWSAIYEEGQLRLQSGPTLRPGDIILMHFDEHLSTDLPALLDLLEAQGLRPALLGDYVAAAPPAT